VARGNLKSRKQSAQNGHTQSAAFGQSLELSVVQIVSITDAF